MPAPHLLRALPASPCPWVPRFCPLLKGDPAFAQALLYLIPSLGSHTLMPPGIGQRPPKPSPEPLTWLPLPPHHLSHPLHPRCVACPPIPKPLFICWGWPHCPRILGPDAWVPSSFLLRFAPRAELRDCVPPLPPQGPGSGLHSLPSGSSASFQASQAVPATRPTRALLEPEIDLLCPLRPSLAVLDKVQLSASPWRPCGLGLVGTHSRQSAPGRSVTSSDVLQGSCRVVSQSETEPPSSHWPFAEGQVLPPGPLNFLQPPGGPS